MKRFRHFLFGSRRRKLVFVPLAALALPAVALAAFLIYTGVTGSGSGSFAASSSGGAALTITGTSQPALAPGDSVPMNVSVTNNDASTAHTLQTVSGSFTTTPSQCASHLTAAVGNLGGTAYPAGGSGTGSISVAADATTPAACAGGSWSVALSGTTQP